MNNTTEQKIADFLKAGDGAFTDFVNDVLLSEGSVSAMSFEYTGRGVWTPDGTAASGGTFTIDGESFVVVHHQAHGGKLERLTMLPLDRG